MSDALARSFDAAIGPTPSPMLSEGGIGGLSCPPPRHLQFSRFPSLSLQAESEPIYFLLLWEVERRLAVVERNDTTDTAAWDPAAFPTNGPAWGSWASYWGRIPRDVCWTL
jgi:hypothetical protein